MNNTEKVIGFITVRTSSTRLPQKCLLPFGESTVLAHIIRRALYYGIEPIVCTSTSVCDDVIETIAKEEAVSFFRGSLKNKLQRWLDCALYFNIDSFHTIDADDPFFDGEEMKMSMRLLHSEGLDMVLPTLSSSSGGASVGYSLTTDIVKKTCNNLAADTDTEMMWGFIDKVIDVKTKVLPETMAYCPKIRLTLDYNEDYWMLATVVRILGNNATRDEVNQLFKNNPDLAKINLFRNDEWKKAQLSKMI